MESFVNELEKVENLKVAYGDCGKYFSSIPDFRARLFMAETSIEFLVKDYRSTVESGSEIGAALPEKLMGEKIKSISVWAKYQLAEID